MGIIILILSVFVLLVCTFDLLYKISLQSKNKKFKNILMYLMSLLLRVPFYPLRSGENNSEYDNKTDHKQIGKKVKMEIILISGIVIYIMILCFYLF